MSATNLVTLLYDEKANRIRQRILEFGRDADLDSADIVLGLADALATIAFTLDRREGKQSIDDRLHSFCKRVEDTYGKLEVTN